MSKELRKIGFRITFYQIWKINVFWASFELLIYFIFENIKYVQQFAFNWFPFSSELTFSLQQQAKNCTWKMGGKW